MMVLGEFVGWDTSESVCMGDGFIVDGGSRCACGSMGDYGNK
jgi:hypothetical protein